MTDPHDDKPVTAPAVTAPPLSPAERVALEYIKKWGATTRYIVRQNVDTLARWELLGADGEWSNDRKFVVADRIRGLCLAADPRAAGYVERDRVLHILKRELEPPAEPAKRTRRPYAPRRQ